MPTLAGHRIEGRSIGGIETCIQLPELKLAFDIGRARDRTLPLETIFFTHGHMDHMGGVVYHAAMRALKHMRPPTYVVPRETEAGVKALFEAWGLLDHARHAHNLVALGPGEDHEVRPGWIARPFRSPHTAPCQGYGLWRRKEKLKPEHRGKDTTEIRRLRLEEGVDVTEVTLTPEIAFTGDTRIEVVEREAVVRTARVLIMEVTFLDERVAAAGAREKGHTHLEEVAERADLFENEALLFTHFSSRYKATEIVDLLDKGLPKSLRERVTPFLAGHRG